MNLPGYDAWKTMCPDDERRTYDCDVCGRETPLRFLRECMHPTGVEAYACPECRGEEKEAYDD